MGQDDCLMWYSYKGKITSDSLVADSIELPTARYLICMSPKDGGCNSFFRYTAVQDGVFHKEMLSDGCYFCGSREELIHIIFKRDEGLFKIDSAMVYPVIVHLQGSSKMIRQEIPVEMINFSVDDSSGDEIIVIDLGTIEI